MGYGIVNAYQEFQGESVVKVASQRFASRESRTWVGATIGATYDWCASKYSVYGEVSGKTAAKNFGDSRVIFGEVGFRMNF